ncbi:unnamed protein product [Auanema sp. JU1783]|nr:unnamed protein product [Auanema sp. JU1783]
MAPKKDEKKEEASIPAVVLLDSFDERMYPCSRELGSWCLQKICNSRLIDYTLSWILRTDVKRVILLISEKNMEAGQDVEKQWQSLFDSITLVWCKNAMSIGDCLRELESRALVNGDFLLVSNPGVLTSSTLSNEIMNFKKRRQEDKNNVMTQIYSNAITPSKTVIGVHSESKRLRLFHCDEESETLDIDKVHFLEDVVVRRDITFTGISICSLNILAQFSDNFDFQEIDDVIRELLVNEELLLQKIHIEILENNEAGFMIRDYTDLLLASTMLQENWFFPLTSRDLITDVARYMDDNNENRGGFKPSKYLPSNVILGPKTEVGSSSLLSNAVIERSTVIGNDCVIENAIIGKNCTIKDGVKIREAIIGDNVVIEANICLPMKCIALGGRITNVTDISSVGVLSLQKPDEDCDETIRVVDRNGQYLWFLKNGTSFWGTKNRRRTLSVLSETNLTERDEASDDDEEEEDEVELDGQFLVEVVESMERIQQLQNSERHMSNLILEINSSKLAYNISMEDVAKNVFYAFLGLPGNETIVGIKALATKWKALFQNYYDPIKNQIQLLLAIEERFKEHETFRNKVAKLVHILYNDLDILEEEAILEWANSMPQDSELRTVMKPIVDWLQEDEDEDDDDEEEED